MLNVESVLWNSWYNREKHGCDKLHAFVLRIVAIQCPLGVRSQVAKHPAVHTEFLRARVEEALPRHLPCLCDLCKLSYSADLLATSTLPVNIFHTASQLLFSFWT